MPNTKKRLHFIDVAKGIGIILVVAAHTPTDLNIGKIIYQFHMPFFFFLSGFFYHDKFNSKPIEFIENKIKGLYIPYLRYCSALFIIYGLYYYLARGSIFYPEPIKTIIQFIVGYDRPRLGGALWFLTSLLIVSLFFLIIKAVFDKLKITNDFVILIPSIICLLIGYKTQFPCKLSTSLVALFFYHSGYLYSKYKEKVEFNLFSLAAALLIIILLSFYNDIDLAANHYTYFPLFIISSFVGIYLMIGVSKQINSNKILEYIGQNTLPIIAYHFGAFMIVNLLMVLIYDLPIYQIEDYPTIEGYRLWWIAFSIVGVFIPLIINLAEKKLTNSVKHILHFKKK